MRKPHETRPGSRYHQPLGVGRTLGQLAEAKMALVAVCRRCQHRKVLYLPRLIERYGEDTPSIGLRTRLKCSACRSSSANLHESAR